MLISLYAQLVTDVDALQFTSLIKDMTTSLSNAKESLKQLRSSETISLDTNDGISLLSLKHHVLLSYLRSLVLVTSRRSLGHSLTERLALPGPFASADRSTRGSGTGNLVDTMVENRVVLEKIEALQGKMRYQIEKLINVSAAPQTTTVTDDPLAFRPNPQNLVSDEENDRPFTSKETYDIANDGIYRPPRLAPVPYVEKPRNEGRKERIPVPSALTMLTSDPSQPHMETTSGLGGAPAMASGRAAYLKRMNEFEEENFTRMMIKKSEARRRARDEADLAMGGDLGGVDSGRGMRRRAGGLEDEFGDVLRSVERTSGAYGKGDGYDELRKKGRKAGVLERSRADGVGRKRGATFEDEKVVPPSRKRSRFEQEAKAVKRKMKRN
ncbi:hypothetical protein BDQ17DRAFT_1354553 [Cyathus striatus]|nr:hypothetical protein BDQ17DRAFT_1354553 [Cyathus striatus]